MKGRRVALSTALLAALPPATLAAARAELELRCESFGNGPQLECLVRLRAADGRPLAGATVTLNATMPSMPMAHHVPPAVATATATPGEYRATLGLEMAGAWSIETDVAGPVRDRIARTLQIDRCEGDRRCPAAPPVAPRPASSPPHRH